MALPSLQFSSPTETLQTTLSLTHPPPLQPAGGHRGEMEAKKAKIMGRDKNNLMERTMRYENEQ